MIQYTDNMINKKVKNTMTKPTEEKYTPPKEMMNTMAFTMIRNIAYKQISKMNKEIKETIQVEPNLLDIIEINMKNAINKIIYDYKQQIKGDIHYDY